MYMIVNFFDNFSFLASVVLTIFFLYR